MTDAIQQMGRHVRLFFDELPRALADSGDGNNSIFSTDVRGRGQNARTRCLDERLCPLGKTQRITDTLSGAMRKIAAALAQMEEYEHAIEDYESLLSSVSAGSAYLDEMHLTLEQFVERPRENTIYWVSFNAERGHVEINAAPLHVGALVQQHLWDAKESIIITSATLQTANSFDYIDDRLNAEIVEHAHVATPLRLRIVHAGLSSE